MQSRRTFLYTGLSTAMGASLAAQEDPQRPIVTTVFNVVVPVVVQDKDGNFVNGLEAKDFTLYDNKMAQDIRMDVSFVPISMVVAVQANDVVEPLLGSIKKIGPLIEGLVLGQQGEAAILKFDHRIEVLQEFTNDGKLFTQALEKIKPGSTTSAMIDSVFQATRMLRRRPSNQRRVLLLIAETQDKGSEGRLREALLEAQFGNIQIYSVNINRAVTKLLQKPQAPRPSPMPPGARPLPPGAPMTPNTVDQLTGYGNVLPVFVEIFTQVKGVFVSNPLEVFTEYTGGRQYSFLSLKSLEQVIAQIGEELHSQYLLSYSPNEKVKLAGGWHDILVDVAKPALKVRTRRGYWMAANPL